MVFEEFEHERCDLCHLERAGLGPKNKRCIPHRKISQMIITAKRAGHEITEEELEWLINDLSNRTGFCCPKCKRFLIWFRGEDGSSEENSQLIILKFNTENEGELMCYKCSKAKLKRPYLKRIDDLAPENRGYRD